MKRFHFDDLVVLETLKITLIISSKTYKEVNSTSSISNKRSSSGEMKVDLKRLGIYRDMDLTLGKVQRLTVKFNIHTSLGG